MIPELRTRPEGPLVAPVLLWRPPRPYRCISSAPLGGGIGTAEWVINCSVPMSYDRPDPDVHLREIAVELGLVGRGVGMLTGVDVTDRVGVVDAGVSCWATVGLGAPAWAAAPDGHLRRHPAARFAAHPDEPAATARPEEPAGEPAATAHPDEPADEAAATARRDGAAAGGPHAGAPGDRVVDAPPPGTVNLVIVVPARLGDAALVNAVATATEAKAQALWELGLDATGTASDAVCVLCPTDGVVHEYAGPRSAWGSRLARAVHAAVLDGGREWLVSGVAWADRSTSGHRE